MKRRSKRPKWIIIAALVAAAALIGAVITINAVQQNSAEKESPQHSQERDAAPAKEAPEENTEEPPAEETVPDDEAVSLDPATIGSIDIPPAGLTVSYIKGVGGFEYEVLRSADGRKYIELRNSDLVGTKCNQDTGVFVSILQKPNESEKATVSKTTDVDGEIYGLSIASPTCTNDTDLLERYQEAFVKPFTLLKKLN